MRENIFGQKPDFGYSYPPGVTQGPFDNRAYEEGEEQYTLFTDKFDNEHGYTISKFFDTKNPGSDIIDTVSKVYCIKIFTYDDECNGTDINLAFEEESVRDQVYELMKKIYDIEQVS